MEKRKVVTALEPKTDNRMAEALYAQSETNYLAIELANSVESNMNANLASHAKAMQAIADSVKPRQKVIDVAVTQRDASGRPSHYRITVN